MMQTLSKEDQPTYILSYPRPLRLARTGLVLLLTLAALVRWLLAWFLFLRPLIEVWGTWEGMRAVLVAQPLRPLIAAHLSLVFAAGAVALVHAFLPDLSLAPGGLAVRQGRTWRVLPWGMVKTVRIASFEESKRRLVLIQGTWSRWSPWPRLVSACLGAGFEPGLIFSSAIRDFGPLVRSLYQGVKQAAPDALFDDEFFSLPARLVLEPAPTLADLVDQSRQEAWPMDISAQAMASVPGGLMVVELLVLVLVGGLWWKLPGILVLGGLEWAVGALYLYGLAEIFPARVEFHQAALLYPLPQIPRALLTIPMAMFVATGVPFLAAMLGLAGVLWSVTLTALVVQNLFRLKSPLPALIGGALQALFQFMALSLILTG